MLEFKKYNSIEYSFSREFMEKVVAEMPADLEYVVQEKVHGANIIFVCGGGDCKGPISINVFSSFFPDYDTPGFDGDVLSLYQFLAVE